MGEMRTMGKQGDTKVVWDPNNAAEVANAQATFDRLVTNGQHLAYSVKGDGSPGEMIRTFDPQASKVILAPRMAGGA